MDDLPDLPPAVFAVEMAQMAAHFGRFAVKLDRGETDPPVEQMVQALHSGLPTLETLRRAVPIAAGEDLAGLADAVQRAVAALGDGQTCEAVRALTAAHRYALRLAVGYDPPGIKPNWG